MALSPLNMDKRKSPMMSRGLERAEESLYKPYIDILEDTWEDDRGREPSPNVKSATANAMHTAKQFNEMVSERLLQHFPSKFREMLTEDNTSQDVSHFTRYEFEMITAMMPNLTATDLVNVHPMDRRRGQIFFMNVLAGKGVGGEVEEGEALLSTQSGARGTTHYSDEHVPQEPISEGDGSTSTYEYFTVEGYVRTGSVEIQEIDSDGNVVQEITDDGGGDLVGDTGSTQDDSDPAVNEVVYEDGRLNFTFANDVGNGNDVIVSYDTDFERNKDGIPDMVIALDSVQIRAKTRKLNAKWLVDAMYDLQQAHERDMEDDLLESITSYLTWEIDGEIHADLLQLAKSHGDVYTFEAESSPSITQNDHNKDFINTVISMANAIKKDTGRGTGNFIVGGMNVSSLIEGLPDTLFDRENDPMDTSVSGPERVGTFANRFAVYQNPYFNDNDFIVGLRGADWRHAGYVYAPYLGDAESKECLYREAVSRTGTVILCGQLETGKPCRDSENPSTEVTDNSGGRYGHNTHSVREDREIVQTLEKSKGYQDLPMYTTPTLQTADFVSQKGVMTAYYFQCVMAEQSANQEGCSNRGTVSSDGTVTVCGRPETDKPCRDSKVVRFDGLLSDGTDLIDRVVGPLHNTHPSDEQSDDGIVHASEKSGDSHDGKKAINPGFYRYGRLTGIGAVTA